MSKHKIIAIIDLCEDLEDTRQQAKVLYPLREIILAALCAVICGADSFVEMAEFGEADFCIDALDSVYTSYANTLSQMAMQRI